LFSRLEDIKSNTKLTSKDEILEEALKGREKYLGTDRHFRSEQTNAESMVGPSGDFADEANYSSYVDMYEKHGFNSQLPIAHTEQYVKKSANMFSRVGDMLKTRDEKSPKFNESHFFGIRNDYGEKAGNWGKGLRRFLNDLKEKDSKTKK